MFLISLTDNLQILETFYVDDTNYFVKIGSVKYISLWSSFLKNIQFTYEVESNRKLPFLRCVLVQNSGYITTTVYGNESNSMFIPTNITAERDTEIFN